MKKSKFITKNPEIMGGEPVFTGTRVPVRSMFEHLQSGSTLSPVLALVSNGAAGVGQTCVERSRAVALKRKEEVKVLVDECLPKPLLRALRGHSFRTAQENF